MLTGCGSPQSRLELQLISSGTVASAEDGAVASISMRTGETRTVEIVALRASAVVTYSAIGLPPFAVLDGPLLTLTPARRDAGQYALTLTATAGDQSTAQCAAAPPSGPRETLLGSRA
jgi:hypothetical protein